jgi:hypothetical protein
MPLERAGGGWRWGKRGKVYRGLAARGRALRQGRAIEAAKRRRRRSA